MNQPSFNNTASTNEHGLSQFYARESMDIWESELL